MLNLELCRIDHSVPAVVADAAKIADEGMSLVISGTLDGGDGVSVKPATDTSGEIFYGVSMYERRPPVSLPYVFEFTLPATLGDDGDTVATLPLAATANSIVMFQAGTALSSQSPNTTAKGLVVGSDNRSINIEGTANSARFLRNNAVAVTAGATIQVQFAYAPSMTQTAALVGTTFDPTPLDAGAAVTCVRKGIVYTSHFDTAKAYSIGGSVGLYSSGRFRPSADATVDLSSDKATIIHTPTTSNPFLGIELL